MAESPGTSIEPATYGQFRHPGRRFYRAALNALQDAQVPFLVGGAFAYSQYAGIARDTKDFDIFVHPRDVGRALGELRRRGCRTELAYPHWLAKAWLGNAFLDIIFNSGNGAVPVDDDWFRYAPEGDVLGVRVKLQPIEEMIWSKAFVMERERSDAADLAHLILRRSDVIDWDRLVARFGPSWRVLLGHLVLFGFVYPSERTRVPERIVRDLAARLEGELTHDAADRVCNGTMLSREQYLIDVEEWDYEDARVAPRGTMSPEDVAHWTAAIDRVR
jgi:hypothetical protein